MENVTVISMHATYGLAVFLFFAAVAWRAFLCPRDLTIPPPNPFGKVSYGIYQWRDLLVVGVIVGFYYLSALTVAMGEKDAVQMKITSAGLIINIGLQFFLMGLAFVMVMGRIRPIEWLGFRWKGWSRVFLTSLVTLLTMWTIFLGFHFVGYQELIESLGVKSTQEAVDLLRKTKDINVLILMTVAVVIVAPLCEEVVFRGYIYPALKKFAGPWIGWVVSALLFSAAHGSVAVLIPLFFFGLILVLLYEWTGSIWAPIGAHAVFNGATVVVQMLERFGLLPEAPIQ
ncbi:MAG: type II CAAX endopeptidase family protein [Verrucomicrobiota bacterium]